MLQPKLDDELARQAALDRYNVLGTPSAEPFDKITSLVQSVLDVPISAVSLIDHDRQWFKSIQGLEVNETPRSVAFCAHTIRQRGSLLVADATEDGRFRDNPLVLGAPHIRSYAGAPLQTPDGYNVGALCAIDTVPRSFSEAQLTILRSFAMLVVDQLELRRIAERDHLTGALSRRGFLDQVTREIAHFRRSRRQGIFALLDIDHFKSINDTFGHPAGDGVLKALATTCTKQLRRNDAFGRLGGEEFGILLTETDEAGGRQALEKIRRAIEEQLVPIAGGIRVTASFGFAALDDEISTSEAWLAKADEALYRAKRSGRNRCVFAGSDDHAIGRSTNSSGIVSLVAARGGR